MKLKKSPQIYKIASHSILSMPDYIGIIARALDRRTDIMYLPHSVLKDELGGGYSPFAYISDFIQDIYRAQRVLGFVPSSAESWLSGLARYYAEEYKGKPPEEYSRRRDVELRLARDAKGKKE